MKFTFNNKTDCVILNFLYHRHVFIFIQKYCVICLNFLICKCVCFMYFTASPLTSYKVKRQDIITRLRSTENIAAAENVPKHFIQSIERAVYQSDHDSYIMSSHNGPPTNAARTRTVNPSTVVDSTNLHLKTSGSILSNPSSVADTPQLSDTPTRTRLSEDTKTTLDLLEDIGQPSAWSIAHSDVSNDIREPNELHEDSNRLITDSFYQTINNNGEAKRVAMTQENHDNFDVEILSPPTENEVERIQRFDPST